MSFYKDIALLVRQTIADLPKVKKGHHDGSDYYSVVAFTEHGGVFPFVNDLFWVTPGKSKQIEVHNKSIGSSLRPDRLGIST